MHTFWFIVFRLLGVLAGAFFDTLLLHTDFLTYAYTTCFDYGRLTDDYEYTNFD